MDDNYKPIGRVELLDTGTHTLLSLNRVCELLASLTPEQRVLFQRDLQDVIDVWLEQKVLDTLRASNKISGK